MKKRRESLTREQELEQEQQMPRITNCLSSLRRLYLNPGVDMTPAGDHPESIRNPRLPLKPNSSIKWCHGKHSDLWNLLVWIKGISWSQTCIGDMLEMNPCFGLQKWNIPYMQKFKHVKSFTLLDLSGELAILISSIWLFLHYNTYETLEKLAPFQNS